MSFRCVPFSAHFPFLNKSNLRGTTDPTQLIAEITDTVFDAKVPFQDGGMTSKYFNDAFMDVSVFDGNLFCPPGQSFSQVVFDYFELSLGPFQYNLSGLSYRSLARYTVHLV